MYELVVIWDDGKDTKEVFEYTAKYLAEKAERDMKKALGKQIKWTCVRKKAN